MAAEDDTAAVKVTVCPYVDGFRLEVRLVVVPVLDVVLLTVCDRIAEVLLL